MEVGANWVHYGELEETEVHPLEWFVNRTNLNFVPDHFDDVIFRYQGQTGDFPRCTFSWHNNTLKGPKCP